MLQVARSTAVADEAIGNVRTVRAFAMEATETRYSDLRRTFMQIYLFIICRIFVHCGYCWLIIDNENEMLLLLLVDVGREYLACSKYCCQSFADSAWLNGVIMPFQSQEHWHPSVLWYCGSDILPVTVLPQQSPKGFTFSV